MPAPPHVYGRDRVFIHLCGDKKDALDAGAAALRRKEFPILTMTIEETATLPGHIFLWEMAVAVAGHLLGINPFDQPNVESSKRSTQEVLSLWGNAKRKLGKGAAEKRGYPAVPLENSEKDTSGFIEKIRGAASTREYIAVLAFLDDSPSTVRLLGLFKNRLRDATGLPVTMGFGPRYLHSTGQLHKGDAGRGLFLQFTSRPGNDIAISDMGGERRPAESFGTLFSAQAWGDWMALKESGRRIIRIDLGGNANSGIRRLLEGLGK
jgi:transaldolase / glucose-6-phosphate isomerase